MAIRITCESSGLEENWIEFTEVWTRPEVRALEYTQDGNNFLQLFYEKAERCHIVCLDGTVITEPKEINEAALDIMDLRLVDFAPAAVLTAANHLRTLGFVNVAVSLNGLDGIEQLGSTSKKRKKKSSKE